MAIAATATEGNLAISVEIETEGEGLTGTLHDLKLDVPAAGAAGHTEVLGSYSDPSIATRKFPQKSVESDEIHAMELVRKDSAGDAISLPLERESLGTRALLDLAEPIMRALERGGALIVDELNLGLHPTAVRSLIALFCNSRINGKNAQLIFTTHDPTIVDQAHFARDQVWLLEKREKDLATSLIRLSDFDEDDRSFADGHLQGRCGVLPRVWRKL